MPTVAQDPTGDTVPDAGNRSNSLGPRSSWGTGACSWSPSHKGTGREVQIPAQPHPERHSQGAATALGHFSPSARGVHTGGGFLNHCRALGKESAWSRRVESRRVGGGRPLGVPGPQATPASTPDSWELAPSMPQVLQPRALSSGKHGDQATLQPLGQQPQQPQQKWDPRGPARAGDWRGVCSDPHHRQQTQLPKICEHPDPNIQGT